jgi:hypothetical protein
MTPAPSGAQHNRTKVANRIKHLHPGEDWPGRPSESLREGEPKMGLIDELRAKGLTEDEIDEVLTDPEIAGLSLLVAMAPHEHEKEKTLPKPEPTPAASAKAGSTGDETAE